MHIRKARRADIPALVKMLASDFLGKQRENYRKPLPEAYYQAFERIDCDPAHELVVMESPEEVIIGTLQLTFIPYLSYQGGIRAQLEAVRIDDGYQGKGYGKQLIRWAIGRAKERGAHLVQLTTDKQRPDAKRFYEQLGFVASHEGMKLHFKL